VRSTLHAAFLAALVIALGVVFPLSLTSVSAAQSATLTLTYQSSVVSATPSGQSPFEIAFSLANAPSQATVSAQLFGRLTTRSGLLSALSSTGPTNLIDQSAGVAVSCLPSSSHGGQSLEVDVVESGATTPTLPGGCTGSAHAPTLDLHCTSGACDGVYPLALVITSGTTQVVRIVTLLTFVEHPAAVPLEVATVLHLSPTTQTQGTTALGTMARAFTKSPGVAVDLSLDPSVLQRLNSSGSGHQAVSALASAVSSNAPTHEIIRSPYVSVDPGSLATSNLTSQITEQVKRGTQVLTAAGLPPSANSLWIATSPLTASTTPALQAAGMTSLVLPDSSLETPLSQSLTWGQPFTVTPGSNQVVAMAADGTLAAEAQSTNDGVLAAMRMLGDLAFLHFERPGLTTPQGVVVAFNPATTSQNLLPALLEGLSGNPLLSATTVEGLFHQVPQGANGAPSTRKLAQTTASTPWPQSQQAALLSELGRQSAFASALDPKNPEIDRLSDVLLATESDALTPRQRGLALGAASASLTAQLNGLAISGADITMTALKSSIPITLTSTTGYSVTGLLTLTSNHLSFTKGRSFLEVLNRPTMSLRIPVEAQTTGDFPMTVTLTSPSGGLLLAHQRILVHATHTSIVAIILTIGSALVLLAWWLRTWWQKPRRRTRR